MNHKIKNSIERGNLVLLLGAGATKTSFRQNGLNLFTGGELAKFISDSFGEPYDDSDTLGVVYDSIKQDRERELHNIFLRELMHCKPSDEAKAISKYPWKRIYTINIDDSFDISLRDSPQNVVVHRLKSYVVDHDQTYSKIDYIKLNGSVDALHEGLIFSPQEYARNNVALSAWYEQLARDFFSSHFLFIGTEINEPSFEYVLELFAQKNQAYARTSHVLTPKMSNHKKKQLGSHGIEFIEGTLKDFSLWLEREFPVIPSIASLAYANNPALGDIAKALKATKSSPLPTWTSSVIQLGKDYFASLTNTYSAGEEHKFYKGFRADWVDIRDGVHAVTSGVAGFCDFADECIKNNDKLIILLGQAGSGKVTALMHAAYRLSVNSDIPVFYVHDTDNIKDVVSDLNSSIKSEFIICFDKLFPYIKDVSELLYDNRLGKCIIMATERSNDWARRSMHQLSNYGKTYEIDKLNRDDATKIIGKVEQYGRWNRLSRMTPEARTKEFVEKSKRQILIALLEVTRGEGFEDIIDNDYEMIGNEHEYSLLHIVGLATINNVPMPIGIAQSAYAKLTGNNNFSTILHNLSGIVQESRGKISTRHSLYVERIFNKNANSKTIQSSIKSIIDSFLVYRVPFAFHMSRNNYTLYKSIINHTFLKRVLKNSDLIFDIYKSYEKPISNDGHFWLQYGLALRDFKMHAEAYDKLLQSLDVYSQTFTVHAVALQEIILSGIATNETKSRDLFLSAQARLMSIDGINRSATEDHYPIITLSEAHVKHVESLEGKEKAKLIAAQYANDIFERNKTRGNVKLTIAWTRLSKFATSGVWVGKTLLDVDI